MKAEICLASVVVGAMLVVASVICNPLDGIPCERDPGFFYGKESCKTCCSRMNKRKVHMEIGDKCWCEKFQAELKGELDTLRHHMRYGPKIYNR